MIMAVKYFCFTALLLGGAVLDSGTAVVILLDTYERLLTENQAKILRMRFDEDLSLSEIGELCQISRQAARDAIKKGEQQLLHYENVLKLAQRDEKLRAAVKEIEKNLEDPCKLKTCVERLKQIVEEP